MRTLIILMGMINFTMRTERTLERERGTQVSHLST